MQILPTWVSQVLRKFFSAVSQLEKSSPKREPMNPNKWPGSWRTPAEGRFSETKNYDQLIPDTTDHV